MTAFVARRLGLGLFVVAGVVVLTFVIARVIPGDPAASWVGPHSSDADLARARHQLGLDHSLPVQIAKWFQGILSGDWGTSVHTHQPVLSDIETRAPASVELVLLALVLAFCVGLPLGLLAARYEGRAPDLTVRLIAVVGVSLPVFWLGLILQLVFFQRLGWLPVAGQYAPSLDEGHPLNVRTHAVVLDSILDGRWDILGSSLGHLVLPAIVVAVYPLGVIARMVRASVLETLAEEHVRMVRALGFSERSVFTRFALRPSLNPVISVVALVFAFSLANTFLVEAVFDWPGLGSYAADSVVALDTPAIIGVTLFIAIVYVIANLLVDLAQAIIDPRIRL